MRYTARVLLLDKLVVLAMTYDLLGVTEVLKNGVIFMGNVVTAATN